MARVPAMLRGRRRPGALRAMAEPVCTSAPGGTPPDMAAEGGTTRGARSPSSDLPSEGSAADDLRARVAIPLTVHVSGDPGARALQEWDAFVRSHPAGDVAQLSGWAGLRQLAGHRAVHVLVDRGGRLVGGAQVLTRPIRRLGTVGYVPYGPLVSPAEAATPAVHEELAHALEELCRQRLRMLFVQPPEGAEMSAEALLSRGFRASDADVAPAATLRIDLRADEAELRRNLSGRLRTWTNTWAKRGVAVRRAGDEDIPLLSALLAATAAHQGFLPFGEHYLARMFRELSADGNVVAFVGEASGDPVAMAIFTGCGATLKLRLLGFDRHGEAGRLNVPGAIHWTAMRWGREHGYRWFDFGGIDGAAVPALQPDGVLRVESLSGPDRYKARFGGQFLHYPQPVELIPSVALRQVYDLLRRSPAGRGLAAWARDRARFARVSRPDARADVRRLRIRPVPR